MTRYQKNVIVGCCLGDIAISCNTPAQKGCKKKARFQITHASEQSAYVINKYNVFEDFCGTPPKERMQTARGKQYHVTYFSTLLREDIYEITKMFWCEGIRRVPDNIEHLLTPEGLAYWFMDDGTSQYALAKRIVNVSSYIHLCTDRYTLDDVNKLRSVLSNKFGIESSIKNSKSMGSRCRIYIGTKQTQKFLDIVQPFIPSSMDYKIKRPYLKTT